MSINRRIRIFAAAAMVFLFLTLIVCWGSSSVKTVIKHNQQQMSHNIK